MTATRRDATPSPGASPAPPTTGTGPGGSAGKDVVLLGPPTADGAGVHVLRAREERIEAGELRAVQEGRPLQGELVALSPRKDSPRICDVTDSYIPGALAARASHGPPQVASDAYRQNWDEIFGDRSSRALN